MVKVIAGTALEQHCFGHCSSIILNDLQPYCARLFIALPGIIEHTVFRKNGILGPVHRDALTV